MSKVEYTLKFIYLRGEHAEVPRATIVPAGGRGGEICTAGGLDVAAEAGDADNLDEGEFDRNRRGDEDGVHGVVGHALAYHGLVQQHGDVKGCKVCGWANAAEH